MAFAKNDALDAPRPWIVTILLTMVLGSIRVFGDCSATPACSDFPGGLVALEIPKDQRQTFANGQTYFQTSLNGNSCWYQGQDVYLYVTNAKNIPVHWGVGVLENVRRTTGNSFAADVWVRDFALTDRVLAPECYGACTQVLRELPAPNDKTAFVDLRPAQWVNMIPVPGAVNIPWDVSTVPSQFPFFRLPPQDKHLILFTDSNRTKQAGIVSLIKTIRQKGWRWVSWYYPGAQGFRGYSEPLPIDNSIRTITPMELKALSPKRTVLFYVGEAKDFRPTRIGPLTIEPAFFRGYSKSKSRVGNPFAADTNSNAFTFPAKMPAKDTSIILMDADATIDFKYQATEALKRLGYNDIRVLRGGLAAIAASGIGNATK